MTVRVRRRRAEPMRSGSAVPEDGSGAGVDPSYDVPPPGIELVAHGVFTVARCAECAWEGPARRSRRSAVIDGTTHAVSLPEAPPGA